MKFNKPNNIKKIHNTLIKKHHISQSKSTKYNLIKIHKIKTKTKKPTNINKNTTFLYTINNLYFYNQYKKYTIKPTIKQLKLPKNSKIH